MYINKICKGIFFLVNFFFVFYCGVVNLLCDEREYDYFWICEIKICFKYVYGVVGCINRVFNFDC